MDVEKSETLEKENPLRAEKRRKLHQLKEKGLDPFPHNVERTHSTAQVQSQWSSLEIGQSDESSSVKIVGRLMTRRAGPLESRQKV